jgi:hypothetical protein
LPIELIVDSASRRLFAKATGNLTFFDWLVFVRTARAPIERRDWPILFDATGATTNEPETSVDQLVEHIVEMAAEERAPRAYVALVARDDRLYRMMLLYETRLAEANIRIVRTFRRIDDAQAWLDAMSAARRFIPG